MSRKHLSFSNGHFMKAPFFQPSINAEDLTIQEEDQNFSFYQQIQEAKIKEDIKKIDNGKAMSLDNILIEVWKCLGGKGII